MSVHPLLLPTGKAAHLWFLSKAFGCTSLMSRFTSRMSQKRNNGVKRWLNSFERHKPPQTHFLMSYFEPSCLITFGKSRRAARLNNFKLADLVGDPGIFIDGKSSYKMPGLAKVIETCFYCRDDWPRCKCWVYTQKPNVSGIFDQWKRGKNKLTSWSKLALFESAPSALLLDNGQSHEEFVEFIQRKKEN